MLVKLNGPGMSITAEQMIAQLLMKANPKLVSHHVNKTLTPRQWRRLKKIWDRRETCRP